MSIRYRTSIPCIFKRSYKHHAGSFVKVAAPNVPLNKPEYVILPICVVVSTEALCGICTLIPRIKKRLSGILLKFCALNSKNV